MLKNPRFSEKQLIQNILLHAQLHKVKLEFLIAEFFHPSIASLLNNRVKSFVILKNRNYLINIFPLI